jgi:hypothetical protein
MGARLWCGSSHYLNLRQNWQKLLSGPAGAGEPAGAVVRLGQGKVVLLRVSGLGPFCTPDVVRLSAVSYTLPTWC